MRMCKYSPDFISKLHLCGLWPGCSVRASTQFAKVVGRCEPWSGHIHESTNECTNTQKNKSMFLSLSPFLSLSKINQSINQ